MTRWTIFRTMLLFVIFGTVVVSAFSQQVPPPLQNIAMPLPDKKTQKHLIHLSKKYLSYWRHRRYSKALALFSLPCNRFGCNKAGGLALLKYSRNLPRFRRRGKEVESHFKVVPISYKDFYRECSTWVVDSLHETEGRHERILKIVESRLHPFRYAMVSFICSEGTYVQWWYMDDKGHWGCIDMPPGYSAKSYSIPTQKYQE